MKVGVLNVNSMSSSNMLNKEEILNTTNTINTSNNQYNLILPWIKGQLVLLMLPRIISMLL